MGTGPRGTGQQRATGMGPEFMAVSRTDPDLLTHWLSPQLGEGPWGGFLVVTELPLWQPMTHRG